MLHSQIDSILDEAIRGDEELEKMRNSLHSMAREIDGMANGPDADLDTILRRARELVGRQFGATFLDRKWRHHGGPNSLLTIQSHKSIFQLVVSLHCQVNSKT